MTTNFQYKARDPEKWKKRGEQSGSQFANPFKDEYKTLGMRKDANSVRILPPTWKEAEHYGLDIFVHYNVGDGTVLCLQKMLKKACPVCEAHARAEAQGREDAGELRWTRRVLVWALDRLEDEPKQQPVLWAMPWTLDRDISKLCRDRKTGELYQIDHPTAGFDVNFDKTGEKTQTKYIGIAIDRRSSSVDERHLKFIEANPLPETLLYRDYDEVKNMLEGEAVIESKKDEEADAPQYETKVGSLEAVAHPAAQQAPPPPPPAGSSEPDFPPEGWTLHPAAPGYYYKGQEVVSEADLRKMMAPPPPPVSTVPPPPPATSAPVVPISTAAPAVQGTAVATGERAAQLRERFQTGKK